VCKCNDLYFRERFETPRPYFDPTTTEKLSYRDEKGNEIASVLFHVLEREIRLSEIWVSPDYRKKGLGSRLVRAVQTVSRATGKKITATTHKGAINFFFKLGFEISDDQFTDSAIDIEW